MVYVSPYMSVCIYRCVSVYTCTYVSGGCRLTVTGSNFNVSSTAVLRLHHQLIGELAETTPVCCHIHYIYEF